MTNFFPSHIFCIFADPWNIPLYGLVGGYVGYQWQILEQKLLDDVNEMRLAKNMPVLSREGGLFPGTFVDKVTKALATEEE